MSNEHLTRRWPPLFLYLFSSGDRNTKVTNLSKVNYGWLSSLQESGVLASDKLASFFVFLFEPVCLVIEIQNTRSTLGGCRLTYVQVTSKWRMSIWQGFGLASFTTTSPRPPQAHTERYNTPRCQVYCRSEGE